MEVPARPRVGVRAWTRVQAPVTPSPGFLLALSVAARAAAPPPAPQRLRRGHPIRRRSDDFLGAHDGRVPERLAEADPELLGGDGGKRSAPLQPVGAIGRALHHLLDLLVAQL